MFLLFLFLIFSLPLILNGQGKFPQPEFETEYKIPSPEYPNAQSDMGEYFDIFILIIALGLASYFAVKKRSRWGLFFLAVFSIIYFGFYRKGCICSVGSIQNMTLSFFHSSYIIPVSVILIFILPLIFALFFGRVFCSSVCPLGAIQEVVIYKPVKLPSGLKHALSMIPYLYLGLAVLYAATGSRFIICEFDPFIPFYRLAGPYWILIIGAVFLITGIFIARPYCRFFCPYGVLLGWMSYFSRKHLRITPDECVQCKLCEDSCPIEAIDMPSPKQYRTNQTKQIRKFIILTSLIPVMMLLFGFLFSGLSPFLSKADPSVSLAEQVYNEEKGIKTEQTLDSEAFRERGQSIEELYDQAESIQKKFHTGSWLLGIFFGLIAGIKLISIMIRKHRTDYTPNKVNCVSCGRCMEYCPQGARK